MHERAQFLARTQAQAFYSTCPSAPSLFPARADSREVHWPGREQCSQRTGLRRSVRALAPFVVGPAVFIPGGGVREGTGGHFETDSFRNRFRISGE